MDLFWKSPIKWREERQREREKDGCNMRCKKGRKERGGGQGWHKPRATEGRGDSLVAWRSLASHGMAWQSCPWRSRQYMLWFISSLPQQLGVVPAGFSGLN